MAEAAVAPAPKPEWQGLRTPAIVGLSIWAAWLLLSLAAGERWLGLGRDVFEYQEFYARLGELTSFAQERFEPGFKAGAWVFKYGLGVPYAVYATVLAGAALAFKIRYFQTLRYPLLAFIAYLGVYYPLHEYTQIRTAVALAFAALGIQNYLAGRFIRFGLLMLLAFSFHSQVLLIGIALAIFQAFALSRVLGSLVVAVVVWIAFRIGEAGMAELALRYSSQLATQLAASGNFAPEDPFRATNILQGMATLSVVLLPGAPRDREQILYVFFSTLGLVLFFLLQDIAVLAIRFGEMFGFFAIPMAFRSTLRSPAVAASIFMLTASAYGAYAALSQRIIEFP